MASCRPTAGTCPSTAAQFCQLGLQLAPAQISVVLDFGAIVDADQMLLASRLAKFVLPQLAEDDWRELYRRADASLYQAKSEGRNRAVQAPPVLPAEAATAAA